MNRNTWTIGFAASELQEQALKQLEFRLGRVSFWEAKKEEVMAEIRSSGVSIDEGLAALVSNYTQQLGPRVMIDTTLQAHLMEAHNKVSEHRRAAEQFRFWTEFLESAAPDATFQLHFDDHQFFFHGREEE